MLPDRFKDQEHLLRVAGLFIAGLVSFLLLQMMLVPKGFGVYGHYRAGALDDSRLQPVAFAGRTACESCHTDPADALKAGKHARLGCEACHGPLARHAEAEDATANKPQRPTAAVCLVCHTSNVAKPAGFPQMTLKEHAEAGSCLECHKPHQPSM